jgi:dihydrofolate reductase (trimethoprim resistance protein)
MTDITRGSGNVFEDLGLENADELKQTADKIMEPRKKALKMLDSLRKTAKSSKFADGNEDRYAETIRKALQAMEWGKDTNFRLGDRVRKKGDKGQWHGHVVGFYSASCTKIGYAVESERETGSVQIYPEGALELYTASPKGEEHE